MSKQLLESCMEGDLNKIKYLFQNENIDIHYQDCLGWNALMCACFNGHLEVVKYLLTSKELNRHANIHDSSYSGENAFIWACKACKFDVVKYLSTSKDLKEHVNFYHKDIFGRNALINTNLKIAQYLIIEHNFQIDDNSKHWLNFYKRTDILEMIQKRELYYTMNKNLSTNDKHVKHRKI